MAVASGNSSQAKRKEQTERFAEIRTPNAICQFNGGVVQCFFHQVAQALVTLKDKATHCDPTEILTHTLYNHIF